MMAIHHPVERVGRAKGRVVGAVLALALAASGLRAQATGLGSNGRPAVQPRPSREAQAMQRAPVRGRTQQHLDCNRCHAEPEFLRQQTGSLERARLLLAPEAVLAASAHGAMSCSDCHTGFGRFPHPEEGTTTRSCASCHADVDSAWSAGVHGHPRNRPAEAGGAGTPVRCVQCHGTHDVATAAELREGSAMVAMNSRCTACHESAALPATDPHAGQVSCAACHGAHDIRIPDDPQARVAPVNQPSTCGACHDTIAAAWRVDVHGHAVLSPQGEVHEQAAGPGSTALEADEPACTACHGAHGMTSATSRTFALESVQRCGACHQDAQESYFRSYHGQAAELGSSVAATCADCHGSHHIFPSSDPRSTVAQDKRVATCRQCHEHARPEFVKYDTHPQPLNRARNPYIFFSFIFMNGVLVSVLTVFGLHTLLWWIRLTIDRRRDLTHGTGGQE